VVSDAVPNDWQVTSCFPMPSSSEEDQAEGNFRQPAVGYLLRFWHTARAASHARCCTGCIDKDGLGLAGGMFHYQFPHQSSFRMPRVVPVVPGRLYAGQMHMMSKRACSSHAIPARHCVLAGRSLCMAFSGQPTSSPSAPRVSDMRRPLSCECVRAAMEEYVTDMLRCMRDVNVDNNTVGWYMSTYMNSWLDPDGPTVATQFQFQDSVPKSVCLVYDPVRTLSGSVHLKAYRLSDRFMAKYRDHQEKQAADKNQHGFTELDIKPKMDYGNKMIDEGITIDDIFEEVPIRIHNSALVMAMLYGACPMLLVGCNGCRLVLPRGCHGGTRSLLL